MAMRDVGIPIESGSGVAAAEEIYRCAWSSRWRIFASRA
jgi:hypothetical protein